MSISLSIAILCKETKKKIKRSREISFYWRAPEWSRRHSLGTALALDNHVGAVVPGMWVRGTVA